MSTFPTTGPVAANGFGAQEEYRGFFELAGVGNAVVDVHTRRFVRVNRRFQEITGYSVDELGGLTFSDITHPDDRAAGEEHFHDLISGRLQEVRLEKRYVRKDGSVIWIHLASTLLRGPDGCARRQLGVVTDITAQRRAQHELEALHLNLRHLVEQRTAALADKSAQLETFVYTVAHDLRAPLRAINGYAELISEDRSAALSTAAAGHLERIKKAARRMDGLIRDLMTYTRMVQIELRIETVPLRDCVQWAVESLRDEIAQRHAEINIETPMPPVVGERSSLDQVVTHLLSNAIKFVAPGVRPRIRIWTEARGENVRLLVADNGIGIAPEYHDRVFRIFERLENARSYPGTGVGLPIVNKTIERLGGAVGLESASGRGSTFWFELRKAQS